MIKSKRNLFLIVLIIFILSIIVFFIFKNKENKSEDRIDKIITDNIIPTVDSSVKVNFEKVGSGEIKISIFNSLKETKMIDFELTYSTKNNDYEEREELVSQGAIGKCFLEKNIWYCGEGQGSNRKIVLGTCSSGICRYHNIIGKINLVLRFKGSYGERIFEREY